MSRPERLVAITAPQFGCRAAGGFGLVIGIDRTGHGADLEAAGADIVVADLSQIDLATGPS